MSYNNKYYYKYTNKRTYHNHHINFISISFLFCFS